MKNKSILQKAKFYLFDKHTAAGLVYTRISGTRAEINKVLNFIEDILQETPQPLNGYYLINRNSYNILFRNFPYNVSGCFENVF